MGNWGCLVGECLLLDGLMFLAGLTSGKRERAVSGCMLTARVSPVTLKTLDRNFRTKICRNYFQCFLVFSAYFSAFLMDLAFNQHPRIFFSRRVWAVGGRVFPVVPQTMFSGRAASEESGRGYPV